MAGIKFIIFSVLAFSGLLQISCDNVVNSNAGNNKPAQGAVQNVHRQSNIAQLAQQLQYIENPPTTPSPKLSVPSTVEGSTTPPPLTTKYPPYVFTFGGAIKSITNIVPLGIRPNGTEITTSAESFFKRIQDLSKVVFCNPFFAGLNYGSCGLLYNATILGLQG